MAFFGMIALFLLFTCLCILSQLIFNLFEVKRLQNLFFSGPRGYEP